MARKARVVPKKALLDSIKRLEIGDLTELMKVAEERRRQLQETAKKDLIAEFKTKAAGLGLDPGELFGQPKDPDRRRGKVAPKYRGPNPGEEWAGRGRTPSWLLKLEKAGRKREEFRVR